jgi:hypothetical protein
MYSESTGNKNQILVGSTSPSKGEVFKKKKSKMSNHCHGQNVVAIFL